MTLMGKSLRRSWRWDDDIEINLNE